MATSLTLRNVKGSALTYAEADANFTNLRDTADAAAVAGAVGSSGLTMSTNKLLGRTSASTGAVQEITVGSGLVLSATQIEVNFTGYLTAADAATTYQPISGMSSYLTTTSAASTYQTQSGMSSYLTTSSAVSTYLALTGGTLTQVSQAIVAVSASAIDCSAGNFFTKTASGALTWTFTNVPSAKAFTVILELTNGGTGTQTWPAAVKWPAGTAPTLTAAGVDVLGFITDDGGTTWRGVLLMKDSK